VLHFLGDTTQLDLAFDRVATDAEVKMAKAADSVSQVGDAMDSIGPSATAAGAQITAGMGKAEVSVRGVSEQARVAEEMLGIRLPRGVNTFIATLPGLQTAISAAFSVGVAFFLIEALVKGIEKIQEFVEHAHKMALAFDAFDTAVAQSFGGLDDKLLQAGIKMDDLKGNHVDALRKQLELIDHVSMHELEQQFSLLAKAADAMFAQLTASWYEIGSGSKGAQNALADLKAQYDLLLAEGKKKEASDLLAGTLKSAQDTQKALQAAKKEAEELNAMAAETPGAAPSANAGPSEKELQAQDVLVRALDAQVEAQKKIAELEKDETFIKQTEEGKRAAEERAAEEKRALDAQLANIEAWKSAQHAAYESGKTDLATWLAAEVRASDAAAIAHEDYLQKVIALYTRSGQAIKAQEAAQQLATLQTKDAAKEMDELASAMNKHHEATRKVVEEYARLVEANVAKDFEAAQKAAEGLTKAEDELLKAQSKLAEDKLSQHYKDQEAAITKLAAMHLITEEQKDDRLKLLEQQQANAALAILNDQLAKEELAVRAAAAKLAEVKLSPGVSPAAVIEAEAELKKLETAVTNTEDQIVQTKEKFNKQSEQDDKSHYGKALLEAMAYGAELLAEQLKQNHGDLLAAENQLTLAKARGENTAAIQKQIDVLKQHEKELEKEANGDKTLILEQEKHTEGQLRYAQALLATLKAEGMQTTEVEKEIKDLQLLLIAQQKEAQELPKMKTAMQGVTMASEKLGTMLKSTAQEMDNAFASAIMGAIASGKSIGQAMEQATATVLKNLATQALAHAIYCTAMGIAELALGVTDESAAEWFAAAAEFGLVAGASGALGVAMGGSGSSSGGGQQAPSVGQASSSAGAGGGAGTQTVGVTHLAAGGVVSRKIMIGDSPSGGDAEEAILPLSDQSAMRKIVNAILPVLPQNAPGFGFATPSQAPPKGFDLSQPSSSDRPDIHSGNPADGDFTRSEASIPRDAMGMEALAASFGGLLSTPTLRAAAGSRRSTDAAAAAALPPVGFDSASMEKFADRVGKQVSQISQPAVSDQNHIHVNVKGMISPDNLNKVVKKINRAVQNRQTTLNASNSLRVTRRSQ